MDWVWYLFRFEGRINRAKLWLAGLIVICWMLFLAMLTSGLIVLLGGHPRNIGFGLDYLLRIFDPGFYRSRSLAELPVPLFEAAGSVLLFWVYFATAIKRLHDRDKSAWWAIPLVALPGFYNELADWLPNKSYLSLVIGVLAFIFCIWAFVELYCLKGSRKTNRFGGNPLAPIDTRPRWEQMSEIEMVPHKAGPPPVWRVKPGYE
ncbi:DUF805 domain-containing protein [Afipia sp. GAS231]|uniref:DUF805 domain-containing protein n=1 Tax=Afipia sp. GAS231 TaxID=1882747 RepID=UPI00087BA4DF|nr:DUF805 domain-containing protein [Afipia sp. GAS231]SDO00085.1 Uncharacterized membrane protein YhaH, DUF805 family [Afipia sp. GAS231]